MSESMIERVARAIFSDRYPDEDWKEYQKRDYCGHARAAIEAMREPTDAMVDSGHSRPNDFQHGQTTVVEIYEAMIDAVLSEKP